MYNQSFNHLIFSFIFHKHCSLYSHLWIPILQHTKSKIVEKYEDCKTNKRKEKLITKIEINIVTLGEMYFIMR